MAPRTCLYAPACCGAGHRCGGTVDCSTRVLRGKPCQDTGASSHTVPYLHPDLCRAVQDDIHPRTELDQTHALTPLHGVPDCFGENDPAGEQAGDLLELKTMSFPFDGHNVLLVHVRRCRSHRIPESAFL